MNDCLGFMFTPDQYCLGFMFTPDQTQVALIRKNKPTWQKGLLNGIGGKVESGEQPVDAMVREFKEEADAKTKPKDWTRFATITSQARDLEDQITVYCFKCTPKKYVEVSSPTKEPVEYCWVPSIFDNCSIETVSNLKLLLQIALRPEKMYVDITYPQK